MEWLGLLNKIMTLSKLLKIIKKYPSWWEESTPGVFQFIMYPLNSFVEQCRYFHPKYCTICIILSKNDFFYEHSPDDERYEIYKYIYNKSEKDPRYLHKKKQIGDKYKKFIEVGRCFEKEKDRLTNRQMWDSYHEFMMNQYINYTRYVVMPECVDTFTTYYLEDLVRKELPDVGNEQQKDIIRTLSTPPHLSFMEKERIIFLELCIDIYNRVKKEGLLRLNNISSKAFQRKLIGLSKQYFWLGNTYANTKYLTPDYYLQEIKKEIKRRPKREISSELRSLKSKVARLQQQQKSLLKKNKLPYELRLHFIIIRFLGEWIDDRKQYMLQANHFINEYCQELARRFDLDIWLVKYYLPEDFKNLLLYSKRLNPKIAHSRRKLSAYVIEKKGKIAVPTIFYGHEAKKIYKAIYSGSDYNVTSFKGQVASAPVKKMTGKVQVIMDTHKEKFTPGNILVATMTRPDFMPYMRRARAIITDEGGLTCHAAIVSRELGIPCIIGTKIATKVLKSGKKVEMDLEEGIIKKL